MQEGVLLMHDHRLGIDVGGTYTDGVLVSEREVLAKSKAKTTEDVTTGIINVIENLMENTEIASSEITMVSLATTHTTNAIIERKGLNKVGIFRLASPTGTTIPPLTGWPEDLREAIGGKENVKLIPGGYNYDGTPISELDEEAIREGAREMADRVDSVAIVGVFSPIRSDQEDRAAEIIREEIDNVQVTKSTEIATISLLKRENSAILNATVASKMKRAVNGIRNALEDLGIEAELFIMQNDGSVLAAEYASKYPIFTVASGPAASIRGCVFLSGIKNGIVIDVGGTSTDIGYIVDGFPRESAMSVEIGGVKTNIRAPDLTSIALGGGTIIKHKEDKLVGLRPESAALNLQTLAKSYGGPMTTVHDIAVNLGRLNESLEIFGTPYATDLKKVKNLPEKVVKDAWDAIQKRVEKTIDEMKTTPEDVPVVMVGGGSMVVPDTYKGASEINRPEDFEVAGALGSTIAEISAYAENVIDLDHIDRKEGINNTIKMAKENLERNGGDRETAEVLNIEEIPFTYMPGEREKVRVKVKGKYGGL